MTTDPCEAMHLLLQAELDGELDAAGAASLAAHLRTCPACAAQRDELEALSGRLRGGLTRHSAPPELRKTVVASLPAPPRRARVPWRHGLSFGAGMALAASVAAVMVRPAPDPLPELVGAHIRALQPGHLLDVVSTDQHTVKPWFDGRLDYAPPVQDFATSGFPLVGGRLDYVGGRPTAVLIYHRDKHIIDLFVWPGERAAGAGSVQGYNVAAWTQGGMSFRAVSDLNAAELAAFEKLWRPGD